MKRLVIFLAIVWMHFGVYSYHPLSNEYQPQQVIDFVKDYLPDNPVVLECGAWNGDDTIRISSQWPKGKIYSFEPIPEVFDFLKERTKDLPNVKVYKLALADQEGPMDFYLSDGNNSGMLTASSSLLPPKEHLKFDNYVTFNKKIKVDAITLDKWAENEKVDHIDFMWLDMQGFELNMLMPSKLLDKATVVYMEVEFVEAYEGQYLYPQIKEWMQNKGFEVIALDFDEKIGFLGDKIVKPGAGYHYFGNAVFYRRDSVPPPCQTGKDFVPSPCQTGRTPSLHPAKGGRTPSLHPAKGPQALWKPTSPPL